MVEPGDLLATMIAHLNRQGAVTEQRWIDALQAVPRHLFVPPRAWCAPPGAGYPIDKDQRPAEWLAAAYSPDTAIITQLDDGVADTVSGVGDFTSSLSGSAIVLEMLELLDPYDGDEVLEIGTGTGWSAALLAHCLGEDHITSIEIDKEVSDVARKNLEGAGFAPRLVIGDGVYGYAGRAPYDRIHVTCGVREVPYAWVTQIKPGGTIVFPWRPGFDGHLVRLTAVGDGTAVGRLHGAAADFMMLRTQRVAARFKEEGLRESDVTLDPRRIVRASLGADAALAAILPGVHCQTDDSTNVDNGTFDLWLWDGISGAHAIYSPSKKGGIVRQYGPRSLWDEASTAFLRWVSWGSPQQDRFGLTVTPEGQRVWLDSPTNPIG
jgi:protein-L-isoaspartate O-methyltransferase